MSPVDQSMRKLESNLITFLIAALVLSGCGSFVLLYPAIGGVLRPLVMVFSGR